MSINWDTHPKLKERLLKLWGEGHSSSAIARILKRGITRNAVIGVIHRAREAGTKVATHEPHRIYPKGQAPKDLKKAAAKPKMKIDRTGSKPPSMPPPPDNEPLPRLREGKPITMMTVESGDCRYPHGDGKTLHYCGNEAMPKKDWCAFHQRLCHQPSP